MNKKIKFSKFKKLKVTHKGIICYSNKVHRINADNAKWLQIGDILFIKQNNALLKICNIDCVTFDNNYLYFKANHKILFEFCMGENYRYFNIIIKSNNFNFSKMKQSAMIDAITHWYDLSKAKIYNQYVKFITQVLNVNIDKSKIKISRNKFDFKYSIIYKINNNIKCVNVR